MKQIEAGALALDTDVNEYLRGGAGFEVPEAFGAPVTLRHLLTHTAGFEDGPVVGLYTRPGGEVEPLASMLRGYMPTRVTPPGQDAAYSNYGAALAGYLVELTGGMPFEEFVERELGLPLAFTASTFHQPYPPAIEKIVAYNYLPVSTGGFEPAAREYIPMAPAGALVMSAADAAQFMLMHLGEGSGALAPATVAAMQRTLHSHHPALPGNANGFWESDRDGLRILGHTGDVTAAHALLMLLPSEGLGVYFATNAPGGAALREALWGAFLDRFYPVKAAPAVARVGDLTRFVGTYLPNRYSSTTFAKVGLLLTGTSVRALEAQAGPVLLTQSPYGSGEARWAPLGDDWFYDPATHARLYFASDERGRPEALYFSDIPMMVFRPAPWHQQLPLNAAVLGAALLLFLSAAVALPIAVVRRRKALGAGRALYWPLGLAWTTALVGLAFMAATVVALLNPTEMIYGAGPILFTALTLGIAVATLSAVMLVVTLAAWRRAWWGRALRHQVTAVALAGAMLTAFLTHWNLLGYRY